MQLEIGSRAYRFRLVDGPLVAGNKRCGSVCDHARREILVSSAVPAEVRLEVAARPSPPRGSMRCFSGHRCCSSAT